MNTENANIKGEFRLVCTDKDGNVKWDTGFIKNGITNTGKAFFAQRAGGLSGPPAALSHLAVGTSNTAFAATQTALVAEITTLGLSRVSATPTNQTTNTTNDTIRFVTTWTASGTVTVQEIGVFNASSGGTMVARGLTGSKTVDSGETLAAEYNIIFS